MRLPLPSCLVVSLLGTLAPRAGAQAPPAWATLQLPGGVVASQVTSIGKLVAYADGTTLHVYSAVTRRWHSTPAGGVPQLRANNDCLLLQEAGTWTAFSSYTGRFAPLPVGAAPVLHNQPGATNDSLLAVGDGGHLHVFSAFTGTWTSRPVPAAHTVSVQRHVAVLVIGGIVGGFDAPTAQWTDLPVAVPPPAASADGTAGFAYGAGTIHAFSATRRTWVSAPQPAGSTFWRGDDWGLWLGSNGVTAYGAVHGAIARTHAPALAVTAIQDVFALLAGPNATFAFSALTNTFSPPLAAPGASAVTGTAVALLADAAGTRAYSAVTGRVAATVNLGTQSGAANVVAWVEGPGGRPSFFSALTGQWHHAPASVQAIAPVLTTTSAGCATATGCVAFSPRTGAFVPLVDPTVTLYGNPSSAPLLAVGAAAMHAFDARLGRWRSAAHTLVGTPSVQIWRTAAVVVDGATVLGFGAQAGSWATATLPAPMTGIRTNSESARISTASHLLGWSAVGEVGWLAQFPEFRRVQPAAAAMPISLAVPAGGVALLGVGRAAAAPVTLPGLGTLLLDGGALALFAVASAPGGAPVVLSVAAPGPAVVGIELAAQAAMLPATGAPWLTDVATVMPR